MWAFYSQHFKNDYYSLDSMRICFLTQNFLPAIGGLETQTYEVSKRLVIKGHEIHLITKMHDGLKDYEVIDGIQIHRVQRGSLKVISTLKYYRDVHSKILEIRPDIVHEQGIGGSGLKIKFPLVVFGRGIDIYGGSPLFKRFILIPSLRKADVVLAQTEHMKSYMKKVSGRSEIKVIPNGIDTNFKFRNVRKELGFSDNDFVICNAGRLIPSKKVDELIELVNSLDGVKLLVVGDGPEMNRLKKIAGKNVVFLGKKSHTETLNIMHSSDIYVTMTRHTEGFPNVLLEAMLSGLPIVAPNHLAIPEIIDEGVNGFVVDKDFRSAILRLKDDDKLRRKISNENLKKVKEYSFDKIVDELLGVYEGLV